MKLYYLPTLFCFALLSLSASAQKPNATPPPPVDDTVVKITTKLVQVDAVVVDKQGKPVTDLKDTDFEVLQDGKSQRITNLTYINTDTGTNTNISPAARKDKNDVSVPTVPVRPGTTGRIITFIVDDGNCSVSTSGMAAAKSSLQKFVNEQMLPGDRVAIYKTRAGSSVLQQFTSDKTQLLQTIEKIRWYPATGLCSYSDGAFFKAASTLDSEDAKGNQVNDPDAKRIKQSIDDNLANNQAIGIAGVIKYVISGLQKVGGRKIVFVLSDGFTLRTKTGERLTAQDAMRDLTDLANRASVVINTIDVRGVFSPSIIEASDEISFKGERGYATTADLGASRGLDVLLSQEGLAYMAYGTGGKFYKGLNDLSDHVKKALSVEKGYYLLAYEPDDDTFKGKNFNNIEIKVKRPDLKVISRPGFYGVVDKPVTKKQRTADSDLYEAIAAPLPTAGLNFQLTAYFGNSVDEGNYVRALIHLPGDELTFVDDADGMKKVVIDVVAVTLDEKNQLADDFNRTHTYRVRADAVPFIRQNGLSYVTDVPIKKAGMYNFRVAIRDNTSKVLGSSSQVIEIPDLKKGGLYLSGLTVSDVDRSGKFVVPGRVKAENAIAIPPTTGTPAMRQFHRGSVVAYAYTLYNAQLDKTTQQPNISVQMKLYRDGQLVIDGKPETAKLEKQADWSRIMDYAYLRLNAAVDPGDYTLQVVVKDLVSTDKMNVSSQSIDFQILP